MVIKGCQGNSVSSERNTAEIHHREATHQLVASFRQLALVNKVNSLFFARVDIKHTVLHLHACMHSTYTNIHTPTRKDTYFLTMHKISHKTTSDIHVSANTHTYTHTHTHKHTHTIKHSQMHSSGSGLSCI